MCNTDRAWSARVQKETTAKDTSKGSSFRQGDGREMDWEFRISRGKLLCIMCGVHKQQGPIAQRANYIQHPVINHNGTKEKLTCMYDLVQKKKKEETLSFLLK